MIRNQHFLAFNRILVTLEYLCFRIIVRENWGVSRWVHRPIGIGTQQLLNDPWVDQSNGKPPEDW